MKTLSLTFILALASAIAQNATIAPTAPDHSPGRLAKRRDVVTRFIGAQNKVTEHLTKITAANSLRENRSNLQVAVIKLVQVKNELHADALENSPEVQILLKEKGPAMSDSSAKLAAQVGRIRSIPSLSTELASLISQL